MNIHEYLNKSEYCLNQIALQLQPLSPFQVLKVGDHQIARIATSALSFSDFCLVLLNLGNAPYKVVVVLLEKIGLTLPYLFHCDPPLLWISFQLEMPHLLYALAFSGWFSMFLGVPFTRLQWNELAVVESGGGVVL